MSNPVRGCGIAAVVSIGLLCLLAVVGTFMALYLGQK